MSCRTKAIAIKGISKVSAIIIYLFGVNDTNYDDNDSNKLDRNQYPYLNLDLVLYIYTNKHRLFLPVRVYDNHIKVIYYISAFLFGVVMQGFCPS